MCVFFTEKRQVNGTPKVHTDAQTDTELQSYGTAHFVGKLTLRHASVAVLGA